MSYRLLNRNEINQLESQYCHADDWNHVKVEEKFNPSALWQVNFSGTCFLGQFNGHITDSNGIERATGIYHTSLHNVTIQDDVRIDRVGILANYTIGKNVLIERVNTLSVSGESSFGNGTELEVLNEGGGRELVMFDKLSAQVAYIMVMYRHDRQLIRALKGLVGNYVATRRSIKGVVGEGSRISNSQILRNVYIGADVIIDGAMELVDGTILGDPEEVTMIGSGVTARHFIILSGSVVDSGALLDKCFIGQSVRIGKQFSAENSLFFANTEGFHGEAVSLFAGPYTVTHHKSTLLIAGMFSFFNAGSGTNQSNHMYKLGPVHQGIVERGSKTGSFSYLLWPSRIGPFSVVMGKHGGNIDVSDLPFSYITAESERSFLTPAVNMITVGTRRDSEKWPKRDKRKAKQRPDLIRFDLFNPYIIGKVLNGMDILGNLYDKTPKEQEAVNYKGVRIKRLMLKSCRKYYEMAFYIFIGEQLISRLKNEKRPVQLSSLRDILKPVKNLKESNWIDMAGMILPQEIAADLCEKIRSNSISDIDTIQNSLEAIFHEYDEYAWSWTIRILKERLKIDITSLTEEEFHNFIEDWKTNLLRLNNLILSDAKKEFDANSMITFGIDGGRETATEDFKEVRGTFEDNAFVKGLIKANEEAEKVAADLHNYIHKEDYSA